jgi:ACT domain-containing protein
MIIPNRKQQQKEAICDQLRKTPIVQLVCEKVGISRATYYRWRKEDHEFLKYCEEALCAGVLLMNDMAESQLLSAIKSQNMTAIIFWLKNRHKSYAQRIEVTTKTKDKKLTEEEQNLVQNALELGGIFPTNTLEK